MLDKRNRFEKRAIKTGVAYRKWLLPLFVQLYHNVSFLQMACFERLAFHVILPTILMTRSGITSDRHILKVLPCVHIKRVNTW